MNNTGSGVDDPDQHFFENYACGSPRNYSAYCNEEIDERFVQQSNEPTRRSARSWSGKSTSKLQEDGARPIIFHTRNATCLQPYVKGVTLMVNSIYNGWRFEDAWLDK